VKMFCSCFCWTQPEAETRAMTKMPTLSRERIAPFLSAMRTLSRKARPKSFTRNAETYLYYAGTVETSSEIRPRKAW
jgi:hypothetical protein